MKGFFRSTTGRNGDTLFLGNSNDDFVHVTLLGDEPGAIRTALRQTGQGVKLSSAIRLPTRRSQGSQSCESRCSRTLAATDWRGPAIAAEAALSRKILCMFNPSELS